MNPWNTTLPGVGLTAIVYQALAACGTTVEMSLMVRPSLSNEPVTRIATRFAADYLGGSDPHNPYASPLYGDLRGLPPTLLHVGSDEILLDDAVRMARKLQRANCYVELEIWPKMPHVWRCERSRYWPSNQA